MEKIQYTDFKRLKDFIDDIESQNRKPIYEIPLNKIGRLMQNVGFVGPINQRGSVRAFNHELLEDVSFLTNGQFTIHVVHGRENIAYKDFKKFLLPYVEHVLDLIEANYLNKEDKEESEDREIEQI